MPVVLRVLMLFMLQQKAGMDNLCYDMRRESKYGVALQCSVLSVAEFLLQLRPSWNNTEHVCITV